MDRILVKDQTDPRQNGTYIPGAVPNVGPMTRTADVFEPESTLRVSEGTLN